MKTQKKPSQQAIHFKLKPISFIVLSLFTQQVLAQSQLQQKQATLALSKQLIDESTQETNSLNQPKEKKPVKIVVAEASTAIRVNNTNGQGESSLDVYDVLLGDEPKAVNAIKNLPTTAERYGASKEIFKTAAVTDAQAQGTGKTNAQGKPIGNAPVDINLKPVTVRAKRFYEVGPLPGLGLTKEEIPGNVQSITAKEIKESHSLSLTDLLNKKLQSVNVNDYQGNPFMMDVTYRGFTAGPQIGTPQGLSVFLDGIRVNEPFGDVVNWDMIPMNAIAGVDVFPGSNPIFGLNTLGGAFTLKTKDGFTNEGVDAEILAGSYGRKQLQVEGGINNGTFALFGAGNFFLEDGWRDDSPSKVNQFFGKASYRGDKLDLNLSTLLVGTDLVGNGLLPSEMYAQDRSSVFSSPDTTKNRLMQFQISSAFQVNDTFSITGQAYRRNSKRHAIGADVFTDYDVGNSYAYVKEVQPGQQYTCLYKSTNQYGDVPDYMVIPINVSQGEDLFSNSQFGTDIQNWANDPTSVDFLTKYSANINVDLDPGVHALYRYYFLASSNVALNLLLNQDPPPPNNGDFDPALNDFVFNAGSFIGTFEGKDDSALPFVTLAAGGNYFYTKNGTDNIKNFVLPLKPVNNQQCALVGNPDIAVPNPNFGNDGGKSIYPWLYVDGISDNQTGYVGAPTAIFNDNKIDQTVDGASIQFNWNFDHHKLMVGAAIDAASAEYGNTSQLGFLTVDRAAYLNPTQALPFFVGAYVPLANNDFSGTNTTKSLYFSETWTPVEAWHFNVSGRYNETQTQNKIAARSGLSAIGIGDLLLPPDVHRLCNNGTDCDSTSTGFVTPVLGNVLGEKETEKFNYYSFNPQIGATWQANDNLNLFANMAKGTRTPSVIELGCALDHTPTGVFYSDGQGGTYEIPMSILENRQCTLPTTLSGDPYLKQIKATSYDIGARGTWGQMLGMQDIQWNLGAYQTDLKDDIYFIAVGNGQGFFDNVGKTRRRGLEAGLSGKVNKLGLSVNYSLTDATFQDSFLMISSDNSSAFYVPAIGEGVIKVNKGNRMPGVPLHNLNATLSYEVTPQWSVGLSAVAHSTSFVRGNENNQHQTGVTQYITIVQPDPNDPLSTITTQVAKQPTSNPGKVPGYATFNFQTSYKFNREWTANLLVNNLFDKEYFSAGRLGRNPFSPSILGAIGPDGYNHNSGDWRSTNFIAPSAPRGVWFSLNWQFDAKK